MLRPTLPNTIFIDPIPRKGYSHGILLADHDSYPPILGVVTAAHPTVTQVEVGEVVVFRRYSYQYEEYSGGIANVMHIDNALGVIEDYYAE